jgi:hypothetical protein
MMDSLAQPLADQQQILNMDIEIASTMRYAVPIQQLVWDGALGFYLESNAPAPV